MNATTLPVSALQQSVLVVAHPDDEILWFGSIVKDVGHIIICFLDDPSSPGVGAARKQCLLDHPYREKITILALAETGTFNQASWPDPETSEFGLKITTSPEAAQTYDNRAIELRAALAPLIKDADNVFTHNPWGEYGHAEHVMVHCAVLSLIGNSDATIWCNNYVSRWSQPLMEKYITSSCSEYHQNDVDCAEMLELSRHYKKHDVWTWVDDYQWFPQECFIRGPFSLVEAADGGWICPLNFIRVASLQSIEKPVAISVQTRLKRKLARTLRQVRAGN